MGDCGGDSKQNVLADFKLETRLDVKFFKWQVWREIISRGYAEVASTTNLDR
jgi:hypothetical protein